MSLSLCPIREFVATMVHSHMAILTHVSDDRSTFSARYMPEPWLAEAAARMICSSTSITVKALNSVVEGFQTSKIQPDKGKRGETAGAMFLGLTKLMACHSTLSLGSDYNPADGTFIFFKPLLMMY